VILLVILEKDLVDIEDKKQLCHEAESLNQMFCENGLLIIVVKRSNFYLEAKLLGQVLSTN